MKDSDFEIKVRLTKESAKSTDPFEVLEAITKVGQKFSVSGYQRHKVSELADEEYQNEDYRY